MPSPSSARRTVSFAKGHAAGLEVFRSATTDLDWLVVTPTTVLGQTPRTGTYRVGGDPLLTQEDGTGHLSYANLTVVLIDKAEPPSTTRPASPWRTESPFLPLTKVRRHIAVGP
ncbi:hypothetical protein ACWDUX_24835 [Streptomyces sp. NPDC003444]